MGDKATHSNLKGRRVSNWVTDQYADAQEQDPLYKAIPFYIGLHNDVAYGIFFDNTFHTYFDFSHEKRHVTSFWADGGEMNYYFFYGPDISRVVRAYTDLTGTPELPPMWAMGFHQSKWSYFPERQVKRLAKKFRDLKIPCDAIYLDIDYMDGFRCFTWDKKKFPDSVQTLVDDGYLKMIPEDPITQSSETWIEIQETLTEDDILAGVIPGIQDVTSGSEMKALNGTLYNSW